MNFDRNNLDQAVSPYLRQHQDNPVWWQEWGPAVLDHARAGDKLIFASVGYATCHWCHVMAQEAFSDPAVAEALNENFVSIKIDREQRPDIDEYLMSFMTALSGSGGWPLNVFLTPDLRPLYAVTYLPAHSGPRGMGLLAVLPQVKAYYDGHRDQIPAFTLTNDNPPAPLNGDLAESYRQIYDEQYGGFGRGHKFPSFCTLIFLSYLLAVREQPWIRKILSMTLDRIMLGGLRDHLQGGFFRYCTDRAWTTPHFEKMLYDQALGLWSYSLAYQVLGREAYRDVAVQVIRCLEQGFAIDGLYASAHDADTGHQEGASYLWTTDELRAILTREEYARLEEVYVLEPNGPRTGAIHLRRRAGSPLPEIEDKLLGHRRRRAQPFVDQKILTSWNCLLGMAFIQADRYLPGPQDGLEKARAIARNLLDRHQLEGRIAHSSCQGVVQGGVFFLEDQAAMLLLLTYLYEETGGYAAEMEQVFKVLESFRKGDGWRESLNQDFLDLPATDRDQPAPSTVALVNLALARQAALAGGALPIAALRTPFLHDFANIAVLIQQGNFHVREAPCKADWKDLPVNTIQRVGDTAQDCYQGACRVLT